jgi:putative phosphoesterase
MTTKLGIISDVHADVHALRDALAQIERLGCDQIVCAGDLVDWGLFPEETIALLREKKIPCIRGNHERWAVSAGRDQSGSDLSPRAVHFLETLPTELMLTIEGVRIAVWHARPDSDMKGIESDAYATELRALLDRANAHVLIVGHTHESFCRLLPDGRVVANPGALLRDPASRDDGIACPGTFAILELPSKRFAVHRASDGVEVRPG